MDRIDNNQKAVSKAINEIYGPIGQSPVKVDEEKEHFLWNPWLFFFILWPLTGNVIFWGFNGWKWISAESMLLERGPEFAELIGMSVVESLIVTAIFTMILVAIRNQDESDEDEPAPESVIAHHQGGVYRYKSMGPIGVGQMVYMNPGGHVSAIRENGGQMIGMAVKKSDSELTVKAPGSKGRLTRISLH